MKEPRRLDGYVIWFLKEWRDEMPDELHGHDVFIGPPDSAGRHDLEGGENQVSTPVELAGGSLLGAPRYVDEFRRLLEDSPHRREPAILSGSLTVEQHLVTPMRSALRRVGRMMGAYLVEVAHCDGDWLLPAYRRGCYSDEIAAVYALEALRRLWREYQADPPARFKDKDHIKNYSDVPWTQLSESAQRAIEAGEDAA